jgi:hypothetical protein
MTWTVRRKYDEDDAMESIIVISSWLLSLLLLRFVDDDLFCYYCVL